MTDTPMTPDREQEIRAREQAATPGPWLREDDQQRLERFVTNESGTLDINFGYLGNNNQADTEFVADARSAVPELLSEVDRLRAALSEATDQVAERDDEIGSLSGRLHHLDRNALPDLLREVEHHKDGKARWRNRAEKAEARLAELEGAPVDEAAELAEGAAGLDAMRADHPAPCRVPDSPNCTCPPGEEAPVVAYRLHGHGDIRCPRCIPAPRSDLWTPVTSEDLPDGGVCYQCGRDVLITVFAEESTP